MPKKLYLPLFVFLFVLLNLASAVRVSAFDWDPVSDQDKKLKDSPLDPGAGAVVLFKRGEIDVQPANASLWSTRITTYTRIKILRDSGRDFANVVLDTPKFMRLSKVDGRTILPSGEIIPLDTSKVFHGVAYQDGKNFAELTTSFAFSSVQPGAIIEYETEEYVDWFYAPAWIFDTRGLGTLQSTLRTVINPDMAMEQLPVGPAARRVQLAQKRIAQGVETDYTVQFLDPVREEPFSTPFRDRALMLLLTPSVVRFSGQPISLIRSWDDVGKEVTSSVVTMNKSKDEAAQKAKQLTDNISDPRGRAEAIYKYLQTNVTSNNLVGVNVNRTADEVITSKRGDPDDINAVFATMLKEVKMDADLVLLATRNWQTLTGGFPNTVQFSRMIVRVNLKGGPVYADAAYPGAPFGELPWFEKGVAGMMIKGSKMVEADIPLGTPDDNVSTWKYDMKLSPNLQVEGDEAMSLKGARAIDYRSDMVEENPEKVQKRLDGDFGLGHGDAVVSGLTHPDFQDTTQALDVKAHVKYAVTDEAGPGELLMSPWMHDAYSSSPFKSVDRQSYVQFDTPEKRVTTSTWTLPPGVQVEKLPAEAHAQMDMAEFSHGCTQSGNTVICTRTLTIKKTAMALDPNAYGNIKKFFDEVAKDDQDVLLLHKQ